MYLKRENRDAAKNSNGKFQEASSFFSAIVPRTNIAAAAITRVNIAFRTRLSLATVLSFI